jgi:hypothetical protein
MRLADCPITTSLAPYLTLAEAAKRLPRNNGRRVHTSTLWRWCRKGCHGVRLHYVRVGRSIRVTETGLNHFFTELTKQDTSVPASTAMGKSRRKRRRTTDAQRQAAQQDAEAILRRAKILV